MSGAFRLLPAQHHFRVVQEIAVDGKIIFGLSGLRPVRGNVNRAVTFLQENDVGYHLCPGIGLKRIVGQTDRAQQLRPLRQIPAHRRILGIHRVAAGDKGHDAAWTHLVQRFCKKVVVDVEVQLVIGPVIDGILAKRHVSYG